MKRWHWWAGVLSIVSLFWGAWGYGLFDLDEGIYAAALSEMKHRGDWIIPTFGGKPFFEKPILMYWGGLSFTKLGVPGELALRLFSGLSFVGLALVVAYFVRRRAGDPVAFAAMLAVGYCPLIAGIGRLFMPDAPLILFFSLALFCLFESIVGDLRWRILGGASLGFAMLAKGPFSAALALVLIAYCWVAFPNYREKLKRGWALPIVAFVVVVSLWYVPVALRQGSAFFSEFVVRQNLGRLAGKDEAHLGPFYYYVPVVVALCWPFGAALVPAIQQKAKSDFEKFLWAWAIVVLVLFSVAGSKLPHYVAPMMIPLLVLAALNLSNQSERALSVLVTTAALGGAMLSVLAFILQPDEGEMTLRVILLSLGVPLVIVGGWGIAWRHRTWPILLTGALSAGMGWFAFPDYWRQSHGHVKQTALTFLQLGRSRRLIEFRMDGMGERLATSHPSIEWYTDVVPIEALWPEEIIEKGREGDVVVSRRNRLTPATQIKLRLAGLRLEPVESYGEFDLFSVGPVTQDGGAQKNRM